MLETSLGTTRPFANTYIGKWSRDKHIPSIVANLKNPEQTPPLIITKKLVTNVFLF